MNLYRTTVFRYLRARRGFVGVVTGFSLFGIMLGVAALIVVMAVMAGFREELLNRILGVTGHATISSSGLTLPQAEAFRKKLEQINGIDTAQPFVLGQGMVISPLSATGALVRGVPVSDGATTLITQNIIEGSMEALKQPARIAIGKGMARQLGVKVGSGVTLLSPQGSHTILGFVPRMTQVRVAAVFDVGMHQYDSGFVYMDIMAAQKFFRLGERISAMDLRVDDPYNAYIYEDAIHEVMGEDATFQDWRGNNRQFFQALQVERVAMFLILAMIVVVAAFNIITGQMMLVNDKRPDIAILRTMGARQVDILRIFFLNGALVGGIGTAFGVLAGLLVVYYLEPIVTLLERLTGAAIFSGDIYFLDELPAVIMPMDILGIALMSLVLSFFASLYPAWRAARLNPVEILRNE